VRRAKHAHSALDSRLEAATRLVARALFGQQLRKARLGVQSQRMQPAHVEVECLHRALKVRARHAQRLGHGRRARSAASTAAAAAAASCASRCASSSSSSSSSSCPAVAAAASHESEAKAACKRHQQHVRARRLSVELQRCAAQRALRVDLCGLGLALVQQRLGEQVQRALQLERHGPLARAPRAVDAAASAVAFLGVIALGCEGCALVARQTHVCQLL
jgi:hypothetical protein